MASPGFPSLKPAFIMLVEIDAPVPVGSHSKGTPLTLAPMVTGTLKSEPSFPVPLDLVFHSPGSDFIHGDPGGEHMRLDAHAILKDVSSETSGDAKPGMVYINYKGIVDITPALGLVLGGDPAAKTTEWGGSFVEAKFETGAEKFKILEQGIFVAAGRFVVEKEKRTVVEYRFSQVCM